MTAITAAKITARIETARQIARKILSATSEKGIAIYGLLKRTSKY